MRKTIRPPKGYRLLRNVEVICPEDTFLGQRGLTHVGACFFQRWNYYDYLPTARKIVRARKGGK